MVTLGVGNLQLPEKSIPDSLQEHKKPSGTLPDETGGRKEHRKHHQ